MPAAGRASRARRRRALPAAGEISRKAGCCTISTALQPGEHIVLVEGYWSAIRLHALGVPVVALMGWSVSPEQIALLRDRGTRFVTLLLDGDEAGRRAREKGLARARERVLRPRSRCCPKAKSPIPSPKRELTQARCHFPNA